MQIITSTRTYATRENAIKALTKVFGDQLQTPTVRWLIAVKEDGRFVPTVLGHQHIPAAWKGIMVIG
jgi:hypothetical protein